MDDWDLLAVVRGRNYNYNNMESPLISSTMKNNSSNTIASVELPPPKSSSFVPLRAQFDQGDDVLFNTFPHLFETATAFDELDELYKPFYPGLAAAALNASSSSSLSSPSTSVLSPPSFVSLIPRQAAEEHASVPKPKIAKEPATKYKKRKNQQKRVVKEVREDGLGSDMWAWRKYGQKPIKGSPYPRSYYRCSSSKGCSARKQVERSPSKPDLFIITYTAEHTHPHPARRNSLAGTTRVKFPDPNPDPAHKPNNNDNCHEVSELGQSSNTIIKMDCDDHDHDLTSEVELKSNSTQQRFFASLDDLERGLEELDCEDYQTSNNENNNNNDDKSELLLLDDGLFFDDRLVDSNCNWFVDQYNNTTVTGAC